MSPRAGGDPGRTLFPALFSSVREDWRTPPRLFEQLSEAFGPFDLDPACTKESALAPAYFTAEDDGLGRSWYVSRPEGEGTRPTRVFLNPPYGGSIGKWMDKAVFEARHGRLVICVVPARVDTRWWHRSVERHAALVYFVPGRVRFLRPDGVTLFPAPFPTAVIAFGNRSAFHGHPTQSDADDGASRYPSGWPRFKDGAMAKGWIRNGTEE